LIENMDGVKTFSVLAEADDPAERHDLAMRVCHDLARTNNYMVGRDMLSQRCLRLDAGNPAGYELWRGPDTLESIAFQRGIEGPGVPTEAEWWVLYEETDGKWGLVDPE
jgi:hypothetical protein